LSYSNDRCRYVRIAIIRRRTILLSITFFTLFFLLITQQDDKLKKKRSHSSTIPVLYNLMEETPGLQPEMPPKMESTLGYCIFQILIQYSELLM